MPVSPEDIEKLKEEELAAQEEFEAQKNAERDQRLAAAEAENEQYDQEKNQNRGGDGSQDDSSGGRNKLDQAQDLKNKFDDAKGLKDKLAEAKKAGEAGKNAASAGGEGAAAAGGEAAGAGAAGAGGAAAGAGGSAAASGGTAAAVGGVGVAAAPETAGVSLAVAAAVLAAQKAAKSKKAKSAGKWGCLFCCGCLLLPIFGFFMIIMVVTMLIFGGGGSAESAALVNANSKILTFTKTSNPLEAPKGAAGASVFVVYTFVVKNDSDKPASAVTLTDAFSGKYVANVSNKESCATFSINSPGKTTLDPKSSVTVTCTIGVNKIDDDWYLINLANLEGTIDAKTEKFALGYRFKIGNPAANDPTGWPTTGTITQTPWCSGPNPALGDNDPCPSHFASSAVDIGAPLGTPVYATQDGTATTADAGAISYGKYVTVTGVNYTTIYGHLTAFNLACVPGVVHAGSLIGFVDNTGYSKGNHLHYEIRDARGAQLPPATLALVMPDWNVASVTSSYSGSVC